MLQVSIFPLLFTHIEGSHWYTSHWYTTTDSENILFLLLLIYFIYLLLHSFSHPCTYSQRCTWVLLNSSAKCLYYTVLFPDNAFNVCYISHNITVFYLWVYNGEVFVHRSVSGLETWNNLLYVHSCLLYLQLIDSSGPENERDRWGEKIHGIRIPRHEFEPNLKCFNCAKRFDRKYANKHA